MAAPVIYPLIVVAHEMFVQAFGNVTRLAMLD
jgi:hypothetical protein